MDRNQFQTQNMQGSDWQMPPLQKNAAYYRTRARNALKKQFWIAVLAAFLASIFGVGILSNATSYSLDYEVQQEDEQFWQSLIESIENNGGAVPEGTFQEIAEIYPLLAFGITFLVLIFAVIVAVFFVLGAVVSPGYQKFNLDLIDGKKANIKTMFSYFPHTWKAIGLNLMLALFGLLTSVPTLIGIAIALIAAGGLQSFLGAAIQFVYAVAVAPSVTRILPFLQYVAPIFVGSCISAVLSIWVTYRYAFSATILAEYPQLGIFDILRSAAGLTQGKKWRLFCLQISFIGWDFLVVLVSALTCGIGGITVYALKAYRHAAYAAFYDDLANRAAANDVDFPSVDPEDYDPNGGSEYGFFHNDENGSSFSAAKEWHFPEEGGEAPSAEVSLSEEISSKKTDCGEGEE